MPECFFCGKTISIGATSCQYCRAPISGKQQEPEEDLEHRVRALLDRQRKLEAIKLYRETTGSSLIEAKDAVESYQAGGGLPVPMTNLPGGWEGDVLRLLGQGRKIQAVKAYQEHLGGSLKDAKQAVDALGQRHGYAVGRSGCLGVVLTLVLLGHLIATRIF